jgi:hypothetical protein
MADQTIKNLDWATKVTLCEQGRTNENRLLQSDRTIFIAIETILFTAVFLKLWGNCGGGIVAIVGIFLTFLWWHISDLRGDAVDRWEDSLANLWNEADKLQEKTKPVLFPLNPAALYNHYHGATLRRTKRLEWEMKGARIGGEIGGAIGEKIGKVIGRKMAVSVGWDWRHFRPFNSARWVFTSPIPLLVFGLWIWVTVECFSGC